MTNSSLPTKKKKTPIFETLESSSNSDDSSSILPSKLLPQRKETDETALISVLDDENENDNDDIDVDLLEEGQEEKQNEKEKTKKRMECCCCQWIQFDGNDTARGYFAVRCFLCENAKKGIGPVCV